MGLEEIGKEMTKESAMQRVNAMNALLYAEVAVKEKQRGLEPSI